MQVAKPHITWLPLLSVLAHMHACMQPTCVCSPSHVHTMCIHGCLVGACALLVAWFLPMAWAMPVACMLSITLLGPCMHPMVTFLAFLASSNFLSGLYYGLSWKSIKMQRSMISSTSPASSPSSMQDTSWPPRSHPSTRMAPLNQNPTKFWHANWQNSKIGHKLNFWSNVRA